MKKVFAYAYVLLIALILLHGWFISRPERVPPTRTATTLNRGDRVALRAVVHRLDRGEAYYAAMRAELQEGNYPTASVFNWRTPLHLTTLSFLTLVGSRVLLAAITIATLLLLKPAFSSSRALLMALGVPLLSSTILVELPEVWAGALIALSIAASMRERWILAATAGVLAVFLRELAAPYAIVAAVLALLGRRRKESLVWLCGGVLYLGYYAWHAKNVLAAMPAAAQAHSESWVQWGGLTFIYRTVECYGWTLLAPTALAPIVVAAGLLAIVAPQMPSYLRLGLLAYVAAFAVVGLPINRYWGMVTVPLWGLSVLYTSSGFERLRLLATESARETKNTGPHTRHLLGGGLS